MKHRFLKMTASLVLLATSAFANASLVLQGGTGSTGVGNIVLETGSVIDVSNGAYSDEVTNPSSDWVWASGVDNQADLTFSFTFSLDGFDLSTATLTGLWGIDNVGTVSLNGEILSSLPDVVTQNFNVLTAFSAGPGSALFNTGVNVLLFEVGNRGGPGGFRASVEVNAEAVSEPSVLAILGLGLIGLGARRFKK